MATPGVVGNIRDAAPSSLRASSHSNEHKLNSDAVSTMYVTLSEWVFSVFDALCSVFSGELLHFVVAGHDVVHDGHKVTGEVGVRICRR